VQDGVPDPDLSAWPMSYLAGNSRNRGSQRIGRAEAPRADVAPGGLCLAD